MEQTLTEKQREALDKFKDQIADIFKSEWDDNYLVKWLRARKFDVNKAEEMLRNSLKYRERMRVDELLTDYEPPEVLRKYLVGGVCGHDRDGCPVRIEPFGNLDMRGIMKSVRRTDLEKVSVRNCEAIVENCRQQTALLGRRVDGFTLIFDMANFSKKMLWRPGLNVYMHNAEVLQNNYPEMQKRMLVINAPRIFPILWKLAQPLISEDAKKKVKVLGRNYREELLKYVSEEELPVYLGGKRVDINGDPMCSEEICHGGDVPEHYYLEEDSQVKMMEVATVSPGSDLKIEFDVAKSGSIINWSFKTDDYDIGFGVHMISSFDSAKTELLPVQRVDSNVMEQDGNLVCDELGKYVIVFDNTYSWTTKKKLYYVVDIYTDDDSLNKEISAAADGHWADYVSEMDESTYL